MRIFFGTKAAITAVLLGGSPLSAQAVRGTLVDRASGRPIERAFVTLMDESQAEVARTLTSIGGTFHLYAPGPGTFSLRSKRIGFRPAASPPLALVAGQTLDYRLEVDAVPVQLPAFTVRGRPECGAGSHAAVVAQLWEEAREALAAVKWTQDQREFGYAVNGFERILPREGRQVVAGRDSIRYGTGAQPFRSVPAEQLARDGYVVALPGGDALYFGPDAEVLLGDVFMSTHCFSARDGGAEHPGLVGLAFEPEPGQKLPDVEGVLWLARESLELRFLEFNYTRLRVDQLGGFVEFAPLSSGPWIVSHWWIRTPQLETRMRRRRPRVMGYRESGGMVTAITSSAGAVEFSGRPSILAGRVVDSSRGGSPLAGATVSMLGATRQVPTDASGRFEITGPFDGEYHVWFEHPRLDSLGITVDGQRVTLSRDTRHTVTLFVPPEPAVIHQLCRKDVEPGELVIVGVTRDSTDAPVPRARIGVHLSSWESHEAGRSDKTGRFVICGVPAGMLTLSATSGELRGAVQLEFSEQGVLVDGVMHTHSGRVWKQDIRLRVPG